MNDLISIIVPVYNEEKHLGYCLDSLLNQSYENIEIICVNDGSTDNSLDILTSYSKKDSRIKVLAQSHQGVSFSRNNGLSKARGKYILFMDADDWIEKDTMQLLYENAEKNNSEIVLYNAIEEYPDKQRKRIYLLNNKDINWDEFSFDYTFNKKLVLNSYLVVSTTFFRKSFLDKYDLRFKRKLFEDNLFHIQVMIHAKRISYLPKVLYHYRKENQYSLQNNIAGTKETFVFFDILKDIEDFLIAEDKMDEFQINFIQYKITELKVRFDWINPLNKSLMYEKIKEEFINMNLSTTILNHLPANLRNFYVEVVSLDFKETLYNHILDKHLFAVDMDNADLNNPINEGLEDNNLILFCDNKQLLDVIKDNFGLFKESNMKVWVNNYISLKNKIDDLEIEVNSLNTSSKQKDIFINELKESNMLLNQELSKKDDEIREYNEIISDKNKKVDELIKFKEDVLNSKSWKMTGIFRKMKK